MKHLVRRGLSAAVCSVLAAAWAYLPSPAVAATPAEVTTVPADDIPALQTDRLLIAGRTGFLHNRAAGTPVLWTSYADHTTTARPPLDGVAPSALIHQDGDMVLTTAAIPGIAAGGTWTLLDLSTMDARTIAPPTGGYLQGFYGDTMVYQAHSSALPFALRRYAGDGSSTDVPVTGLPARTAASFRTVADATAGVVAARVDGALRYGLVDLATGKVALAPTGILTPQRIVLTDDRLGFLYADSVQSFSRVAIMDGTATTPDTVAIPSGTDTNLVRLVGADAVIVPKNDSAVAPALRYSPGGGTPEQVVAAAEGRYSLQSHDGALLVGGSTRASWSVLKVTPGGTEDVRDLHSPLFTAGLTLTSGYLRHLETLASPGETPTYVIFRHQLTPGSDVYSTGLYGGQLTSALPCAAGAACVRTVGEDSYGLAYVGAGATAGTTGVYQLGGVGPLLSLPSATGSVADASPRHVIVNGSNPARQYVVSTATTPAVVTKTLPVAGAALWYATMWSGAKAGYLQPTNVDTDVAGTAVPTGSPCAAAEVQATANYVYWSCGSDGPAGVYDLVRKRDIPLPAARHLLGDGYVVRHDPDGDLVRTDLASGDTATVGSLPRGSLADDRNITWTVDKFGGDVAYVDPDNTVHVVDPAVTRSTTTGYLADTGGWVGFPSLPWDATYWLSRPVDSWTTTITQVRTGEVVATDSGGSRIGKIITGWTGYIGGKRAPSGPYRYSISATVGGVVSAIGSGTLTVSCGTPNLHDYDCSGQPTVLGVRKSPGGQADWLTLRGTKVTDNGAAETWSIGSGKTQVNAVVPFGDINQDYHNDLLVRHGDGSLRAYYGTGQASFSGAKSVVIRGSFSRYNALVCTGDITGDGKADLIARDTATGVLYRYAGNGTGGFGAAVKLAGSYKGYSRVVGAGDVTGDGKADLLLLSGTTMYGLYGNGDGTFGSRFLVGTRWPAYNAVIGAGDVNDDGHNDLVARDAGGNLWLLPGNGHNGFGGRVKLGTGYQKYAYLY